MSKISLNNLEKKPISIAKFDNTNAVEVVTLTVTHEAITEGDITLTAGAEVDTITLAGTDNTAILVATKIQAYYASSTLWDVARNNAIVTLTRKLAGAVDDMVLDPGTTSVLGTITIDQIEVATVTVTHECIVAGDLTFSVAAEADVVAGVLITDDTPTKVATAITAAFAGNALWTATQDGAVVTLRRKLAGAVADMTVAVAATEVLANIVITHIEEVTLTVTHEAILNDDVTITCGTEVDTVTILGSDNTPTKVATTIETAYAASTLWTVTRLNAVLTFTRTAIGFVSDMIFDGGTSSVTATVAVSPQGDGQTLLPSAVTYLNFALITEDNYGSVTTQVDSLVNPFIPVSDWNYVVPKSGIYDIQAQVLTAPHTLVAGKKYELSIYVNGSKACVLSTFQSQSTTSSYEVFLKGISTLRLAKGDIVKIAAFTNSAVNVILSTSAIYNKVIIMKKEVKIEEN